MTNGTWMYTNMAGSRIYTNMNIVHGYTRIWLEEILRCDRMYLCMQGGVKDGFTDVHKYGFFTK